MIIWLPDPEAIDLMGSLPAGMTSDLWTGQGPVPASRGEVEIVVLPYLNAASTLDLLPSLPRLRLVQSLTAGVDGMLARMPAGVTLARGEGIHDPATSEWVLGAVLASLHRFPRFAVDTAAGRWEQIDCDELTGKRVLLVGYGSVGRAVEARLAPFDVALTKVARSARPGVHGIDELHDLLPAADVVILVVPLTAQTRGLINATALAALPDGALLVNASRGPVVVTDDLVSALASGRIWAALDVTDPEPLPAGHPLWSCPNLLITPHVGGKTSGWKKRAYQVLAAQLARIAAGEQPRFIVTGDY